MLSATFYGKVFDPTGYGTASRAYIHALSLAGIHLQVVNLSTGRFVSDPLVDRLVTRSPNSTVNIFNYLPSRLPLLSDSYARTIALLFWETDVIPESWRPLLNQVMEIWVPCQYNLETVKKYTRVPVFEVPLPVRPDNSIIDCDELNRLYSIRESDFVFYGIFAWQNRKLPLGTIEAFLRAFQTEMNTVLILKTHYQFVSEATVKAEVCSLRQRLPSKARVIVAGGIWPEERIMQLHKRGNCYVSLHRSEGWGYPLFDAASYSKPVISTNFAAPAEYLNPNYHHMIDFKLVTVDEEFQNYTQSMQWAEPDLEHASASMRFVYENQREARTRAAYWAQILHMRYSSHRIGEIAKARLLSQTTSRH